MERTTEHTFLFADLVGFTALTEQLGDEGAADVAVAFLDVAGRLAEEHGCELVKGLGDGVMVHGRDAARVVQLGVQLARRGGGPAVRVGIHTGAAVQRDGDWYGATVNVASRLTDAAGAGEVLMSAETRARAATRAGLTVADRGARSFKNVTAPLAVFAAA